MKTITGTALLAAFAQPALAHNSHQSTPVHLLQHGVIYAVLICALIAVSMITVHRLAKFKDTPATK